jgi:AAA lid domain
VSYTVLALGNCADVHRQGMVRINFQPYTTAQLEQIVHARLGGSNEVLSKDAVKFAAMKVSSISGDARRVLDICRCVPSPTFLQRAVLRQTNVDGL